MPPPNVASPVAASGVMRYNQRQDKLMQLRPHALFPDTDPQTEEVLLSLLRHASPARKLAMIPDR
jgi:hypothetical protein